MLFFSLVLSACIVTLTVVLVEVRKDLVALRTRVDELSKRHIALLNKVNGAQRAKPKHNLRNLSRFD